MVALFLRSFYRTASCLGAHLALVLVVAAAPAARATGTRMFTTVPASTGEKPQSKIWYHDGSYWAILQGPDGLAFYEKDGGTWRRGTFMDAILATSGQADVKWNGAHLFVLNYSGVCKLYKYTYDGGLRVWKLVSGFPVTVPNPSGSETMVLEQDSTGRLWTTAEGSNNINVYYSTSADHRTWSTSPVILRSGINVDDISSIVAFGGNKIGVFWSDQNRDEFGFCVHQDGDAPTSWGPVEVVTSGSGVADDHVNLAFDSQGRVYAITKDDFHSLRVHRRAAGGGWTTKTNVAGGGEATRGILMVAEADAKVYILFTRWLVTPERIEYRVADISSLNFGGTTTFISSSQDMNNVTGMKQILPAGQLLAIAEDGYECWYNSLESPPGGNDPPESPTNVRATLLSGPTRVSMNWTAPSGGCDGYDVYRQGNSGSLTKLNGSVVTETSYTDSNPPQSPLCYYVRALKSGLESQPSAPSCVDNSPLPPPGAPQALQVSLDEAADLLRLDLDEGSGQTAFDASGNGHHARLGSSAGSDANDPAWVAGVAGTALDFDGSNDYLEIADAPALDPAGSFTIEAWLRHEGGTGTIVNKGASGERTYRVRVTSSRDIEFRWETASGSAREVIAEAAIPNSAWHHVACVYDAEAGQNRIYVDGTLRATGSASGTPAANNKALHIGARYTSSFRDFLDGTLDAVRIAPEVVYTSSFTPAAAPAMAATRQRAANRASASAPGAALFSNLRARLSWQPPTSGAPAASYNVYRAVDGGTLERLNAAPITARTYSEASPPVGQVCYRVTAVNVQGLEGTASGSGCIVVLPPVPAAPQGLDATLIALPADAPTGVAAYEFDEGSGHTFADVTGNGHAGQLGATTSWDGQDPRWTSGIRGAGLRFDGVDDRAYVPDAPALRLQGDFTLETWFAIDSLAGAAGLVAKGLDRQLNFALRLDAGRRPEFLWDEAGGGRHALTAAVPILDRDWHHLAAVRDAGAGESRLYVDGSLVAAAPDSGLPATSAAHLRLGAVQTLGGYSQHFSGYIDEVRLAAAVLYEAPFARPRSLRPARGRRVDLAWQPVGGDLVFGYRVYRRVDGGVWERLDASPVTTTAFADLEPPEGSLCYQVATLDTLGRESAASAIACAEARVTDAAAAAAPPAPAGLRVHPNPFNPGTWIAFDLPASARAFVAVYDARGRHVATLADCWLAAGTHVVRWDGSTAGGAAAASGTYFAVLAAGTHSARHKLVLLK